MAIKVRLEGATSYKKITALLLTLFKSDRGIKAISFKNGHVEPGDAEPKVTSLSGLGI